MSNALERFLRYTAMDTTSREDADTTPSTPGQRVLGALLVKEMQALGVSQPEMDENGYVYGLIPKNTEHQPTIALIAHLDTVDAVPGRAFAPRVVHFTGEDILLNDALNIRLSTKDFPELAGYQGQDLVVTDGTTVLGADDKAGIAQIMTAAEILLKRQDIPHGDVWLVFTPDEEIGSGADLLQLDKIKADFGYTVDGGPLNDIEFENFNAASARIVIKGRNVHPGAAKGKMINALQLAIDFHQNLPAAERPEQTEKYEGFYHLHSLTGGVENAQADYLIRDHDQDRFKKRKQFLLDLANRMNQALNAQMIEVHIKDSYQNMAQVIQQHPHVVQRAEKAIKACGMVPSYTPIRGGTDGARLSFRGLPCPNLGTGAVNSHGVYEFQPVDCLQKMAEVLVEIVRA